MKIFLTILLCSFCAFAKAQNDTLQPSTEVDYNLSATGLFSFGNKERQFLVAEGELNVESEKVRYNFLPSLLYNRVNKNIAEYDYYAKGLVALNPKERWQPFAVTIYEYTERRRVDFRLISGLGLSYQVIKKPQHNLYLQFATLYDYTIYDSNDFEIIGLQDSRTRKVFRPSPRIVGEHLFKNNDIKIAYSYWYHSSFNTIDDSRMRLDLNINYKITHWLSFRTSIDYFFENIVVKDLNSNDLLLSFGINIHNK